MDNEQKPNKKRYSRKKSLPVKLCPLHNLPITAELGDEDGKFIKLCEICLNTYISEIKPFDIEDDDL